MDTEQALRRPIGWWLKEADDRLEAAFDARLRGHGINRRGWQVLASVARAPVRRTDLVADLAAFDPAPTVERVVADLHARGWLEDDDGLLRLTAAGEQEQRELARRSMPYGLRSRPRCPARTTSRWSGSSPGWSTRSLTHEQGGPMAKIKVVQMAALADHPWQYLDDKGRVWLDAGVTYRETGPDGEVHSRKEANWQLLELPDEPETL